MDVTPGIAYQTKDSQGGKIDQEEFVASRRLEDALQGVAVTSSKRFSSRLSFGYSSMTNWRPVVCIGALA